MQTHRLSFTALLVALFALAGVRNASACKYCWSAENADAAEYTRQAMSAPAAPDTQSGAFPLDSTINKFQAAPTTALATPPPAGSIVTNAADLRAAKPTAPAAVVAPAPVVNAPAPAGAKTGGSTHYADAGLLGLAAMGGVFCWRTRRKTGSGR